LILQRVSQATTLIPFRIRNGPTDSGFLRKREHYPDVCDNYLWSIFLDADS
jgi:hypothetical protein